MKSKKKLLLMGVGVMGALAMGVGATSTFAWYTAQEHAYITNLTNKTSSIVTTNGATLADINISIKVNWMESIPAVTLTAGSTTTGTNARTLGTTYVIDQNDGVVAANNQKDLVKSKLITFTFSRDFDDMAKLPSGTLSTADLDGISSTVGDDYNVYVEASNYIRVDTSRSGKDASATSEDNNYVGEYTPRTYVLVGTLTVKRTTSGEEKDDDEALTYTYAPVCADASGNFGFYYSLSPQQNTAEEGSVTDASYGTITVHISRTTLSGTAS